MWCSGNQEGYGGVGVLVKEGLHDKVVEVRRVIDRVMSLAVDFLRSGGRCMRICCAKW